MEKNDTYVLDDTLWDELIELTDGAVAPCFQCGVCTATCPWGLVRDEPFSVRTMMRMAQVGLFDEMDNLWLCTTCAHCEAYCPRGVPISDVFRGLRQVAWERKSVLEGLPSVLWSVHWNNNPWAQPPSHRSHWAGGLDLPAFDAQQHEILLYIGCTSSFDRRAQNVARAVVQLLRHAGIEFGVLGDDEPCCGESVLSLGHEPYFQEIAENSAKVFLDRGVQKLVTISPHCYDVFRNHYPRFESGFEPLHYTQLLATLIEEGRLDLGDAGGVSATLHDPCYLGRINGEYEAPRKVVGSITGTEVIEMEHSKIDGLCCGGGGGRMWMETPAGERFSDLRVKEAKDVGASVLITACPSCIACLEDSIKSLRIPDLQVMDVAELAASTLAEEP